MLETLLPCAPELWATTPDPDHPPLLEQLVTLRLENAALQERIRELEARLGQNSANSSRPPSSDPPHVLPKQRAVPSGRIRGGQPGRRGTYREMLPLGQVDEIVAVGPERCRQCRQHRHAPGE